MKQLTEAELAELLRKTYKHAFNSGVSEVFEDAETDEFIDLEDMEERIKRWVDSV